jgi:hypothetical protein
VLEELRDVGLPVPKQATTPTRASSASVHPIQPTYVATSEPRVQTPFRPQPKPPAQTPETLMQAIDRMRGRGYSVQQVATQVRRWHPGLSLAQARSMVRSAGNPVARQSGMSALPKTAATVVTPIHAASNCTPLVQARRSSDGFFAGVEHAVVSEAEVAAPVFAGAVVGGIAGAVTLNPAIGVAAGAFAAGGASFAVSRLAKHETWKVSAEHAEVDAALQFGGDLLIVGAEDLEPTFGQAAYSASLAGRRRASAATSAFVIRISTESLARIHPR